MATGGFAASFDHSDTADVKLVIKAVQSDENHARRQLQPQGTACETANADLYVHATTLMCSSPVWKAQLERWQDTGKPKTITMIVEEGEQAAAYQLVQSLYTGCLSDIETETDLRVHLGILMLADQYQVESALSLCAQKLDTLEDLGALSWDLVDRIMQLPAGYLEEDGFCVMVKIQEKILQHAAAESSLPGVGLDLELVMRHSTLEKALMALPLRKCASLLSDDRCRVASENTVATAVFRRLDTERSRSGGGNVDTEQSTSGGSDVDAERSRSGGGNVDAEQSRSGGSDVDAERSRSGGGDGDAEQSRSGGGNVDTEQSRSGGSDVDTERLSSGGGDVDAERSRSGGVDVEHGEPADFMTDVIRVPQLSSLYAAALPTFASQLTTVFRPELYVLGREFNCLTADLREHLTENASIPRGWLSGRRPPSTLSSLDFDWEVSGAELADAFEAREEDLAWSPTYFFAGMDWAVLLQATIVPGNEGRTLGVFIDGEYPLLNKGPPYGAMADVTVLAPDKKSSLHRQCLCSTVAGTSWGWPDYFRMSPMQKWDQSCLNKWTSPSGSLTVHVKVSNVM